MKLKTKESEYYQKNFTLKVSEDLKEVSASSYGWWHFVATDSVGNVYFNNSTYSNSTGSHQGYVSSKLEELGVKVSVCLHNTTDHFGFNDSHIKRCIESEIKEKQSQITELNELINKKGTRKKKNEERKAEITNTEYRIKDLERIIECVGVKPIPGPKKKLQTIQEYIKAYEYSKKKFSKDRLKRVNTLKRYYKKGSGKVDWNTVRKILDVTGWQDFPRSIDKTKAALGVKGDASIDFILLYRFSKDTENMIPAIDSIEYKQLLAWCKRFKNHPRNVLLMDKLHTYLTNKVNRKNYVPSEPKPLPVHPKLRALEGTENLELIKTDRDLKAEGRKQSHCIGSKSYILQCQRGYQALNYKGYTFFLDSKLRINQTHGKHNRHTPENVRSELLQLLKAA